MLRNTAPVVALSVARPAARADARFALSLRVSTPVAWAAGVLRCAVARGIGVSTATGKERRVAAARAAR